MHQLELERQNVLRSAAEVREDRTRKLANMTTEEKTTFLEEEKEQKKEKWIKKQVQPSPMPPPPKHACGSSRDRTPSGDLGMG